jgi:hypothetical protein
LASILVNVRVRLAGLCQDRRDFHLRPTPSLFALTVGTSVPTTVRVVEVSPVLVEIHPEWRGHLYFVVGDEIIIVDRNHRIIAVISV